MEGRDLIKYICCEIVWPVARRSEVMQRGSKIVLGVKEYKHIVSRGEQMRHKA